MSPWNARADTSTSLIMWLGALLAVIICVTWYVKNIYPVNVEVDKIDDDLKSLQLEFSDACNSDYYRYEFNPGVERGTLTIDGLKICIRTKIEKCSMLICNSNTHRNFTLDKLAYIVIERNNSVFSVTAK